MLDIQCGHERDAGRKDEEGCAKQSGVNVKFSTGSAWG
jgi:hypothetical protein